MIGEAPLVEELRAGWFAFSEDPDQIAAVVASFDHTFNYHKLQVAFNAIHAGRVSLRRTLTAFARCRAVESRIPPR